MGCVSIGTVYVVVGVLALLALAGILIEAADEDRMVQVLMDLPGGAVLVWILVIGMVGYTGWRVVEVIADPYEFGSDWRGLATRGIIGLTAMAYGFLAFSIARLARAHVRGGQSAFDGAEEEQQLIVAQVLGWPAGEWLVAFAGLALVAVGLGQFAVLLRRGYTIEVSLEGRSPRIRRGIHVLAWYGYSARGVILVVLGYFLLRAAVRRNPADAGDTDTAFDYIGGGLVGDSAFFVVALGTIAYGVFMYLNAWFYRFK
jgi:hypothetical protein